MLEQEFYDTLVKDNMVYMSGGASGIYVNNIIQARIDVLIDIFPAVTACLSEEYIRYIAKDYCRRYDSPQGNLNLYGNHFGAYLANLPECTAYPYIRDLADFEYMIQYLLYVQDENNIIASDFVTRISNQESLLMLQASIGFSSCYKIAEISDFCLQKTQITPDINQNFSHYLLYRDTQTHTVFVKTITTEQMEIIPILKTQGIFGLSETTMGNPIIQEFLSFLTVKNLWVM
jgi:hypothetical protein